MRPEANPTTSRRPPQAIERASSVENFAADDVESDIDALPAGGMLYCILEVVIGNGDVGAVASASLRFSSDEATAITLAPMALPI